VTELGYGREANQISRVCQCLAIVMKKNAHSVRIGGSAVIDLCYLAAGRVDLVYAGLGGRVPWKNDQSLVTTVSPFG
jgi:fructose-1,6-bisphosphatase/inositol monophosphatase family enzyme